MSAIFNGEAMEAHLRLADKLVWRDVTEYLPDDLEEVLVYREPKHYQVAYRVATAWVAAGTGEHLAPTFWLPLPDPPTPEENLRYDEAEAIERAAAGIIQGEEVASGMIPSIAALIIDQLKISGHLAILEEVDLDATFHDLNLDSLDRVELVQIVEDRVGKELPREQYVHIQTIRDLATALSAL